METLPFIKVIVVSWGVPFVITSLEAGELIFDFVTFNVT